MAAKKKAPKKAADPAPRPSRKAKPKIGRPPRAGKAATSGIVVRLTAEEREALDAAAQRAGKSLSVFVRDAILSLCEKS